jgi:hypothetical protein
MAQLHGYIVMLIEGARLQFRIKSPYVAVIHLTRKQAVSDVWAVSSDFDIQTTAISIYLNLGRGGP